GCQAPTARRRRSAAPGKRWSRIPLLSTLWRQSPQRSQQCALRSRALIPCAGYALVVSEEPGQDEAHRVASIMQHVNRRAGAMRAAHFSKGPGDNLVVLEIFQRARVIGH